MKINEKGFTLIELLAVVLIIGILAAIALPQYHRSVRKAKFAELDTIVDTARKNMVVYNNAHAITNDIWFTGSDGVGDIEMPGNCRADETMCSANIANYWAGCWAGNQQCYVEVGDDGSFLDEAYFYLYKNNGSEDWHIDISGNERDRRDICEWARDRRYQIDSGCAGINFGGSGCYASAAQIAECNSVSYCNWNDEYCSCFCMAK